MHSIGPQHYERGSLLFQQERYRLAEKEFREELAHSPDNSLAQTMLAFCLTEQGQHSRAREEAKNAVERAPDLAFPYYVLAYVQFQIAVDDHLYWEAETIIIKALALEPLNPTFYWLLARIRYTRREPLAALNAIREGLALDPVSDEGANLEALVLLDLGQKKEAASTLQQSLTHDPENATTHALRGWAYFHEGVPEQAQHHLREALRLDPMSKLAQRGMLVAIKARYRLYRPIHRYFLIMSSLSLDASAVTSVLGMIFTCLLLMIGIEAQPEMALWCWSGLVLLTGCPYFVWVINALCNLMLVRDKLLSPSSVPTSVFVLVGGLFVVASLVVLVLPGLVLEKKGIAVIASVVMGASMFIACMHYHVRGRMAE